MKEECSFCDNILRVHKKKFAGFTLRFVFPLNWIWFVLCFSISGPASRLLWLQHLLPVQLRGVRLPLLWVSIQWRGVARGCEAPPPASSICPVSLRRWGQQPVSVFYWMHVKLQWSDSRITFINFIFGCWDANLWPKLLLSFKTKV